MRCAPARPLVIASQAQKRITGLFRSCPLVFHRPEPSVPKRLPSSRHGRPTSTRDAPFPVTRMPDDIIDGGRHGLYPVPSAPLGKTPCAGVFGVSLRLLLQDVTSTCRHDACNLGAYFSSHLMHKTRLSDATAERSLRLMGERGRPGAKPISLRQSCRFLGIIQTASFAYCWESSA